jgi:preprotein translocase subunit SecG
MFSFLLVVQILVSLSIITLVMLQQGKGADMGAAFGSGSSGTVFGARGSGSFFSRATGVLAAVFFINCLLIASPLIRESTRASGEIADQLEQQGMQQQAAEQTEAIVEALEQQAESEDVTAEVNEAFVVVEDVPSVADEPPAELPVANDLPE